MDEQSELMNKLKEYFSHQNEIDTAILFGSFAKGTQHKHSDVDIAIHSKKCIGYETLANMQMELSLLCKREIDLADLSKAQGLFLYQIMTKGIRIKFDRNIYVKYLNDALCFREDYLPTMRYFQNERLRRFVNG